MLVAEKDHGAVRLRVEPTGHRLEELLDHVDHLVLADREGVVQGVVGAAGLDQVDERGRHVCDLCFLLEEGDG